MKGEKFGGIILIMLFVSGCVSQQKYQEMVETKKYYEGEAEAIDSIKNEYRALEGENRELEAYLKNTLREIEQLKVTNISLDRTYQDLLQKYNRLVQQTNTVLSTSSYEKISLQEQLSAHQEELDRRERELGNLEQELTRKEAQMYAMTDSYDQVRQRSVQDQKLRNLEARLQASADAIQQIKENLYRSLYGLPSRDLAILEENGRLVISLSDELLFIPGSNTIQSKGKEALRQIVEVLKTASEMDITVQGHTTSEGRADQNWDLSVLRATTVVRELTAYGLDPRQLTAAGRGAFAPVTSDPSAAGIALNRRVEIILSPRLGDLYQIIDGR